MITVSMTVNGEKVSREVEDNIFLAYYLREALGLTGTHVGCDTTQCGCCVVIMNGMSVKSCTVLAGSGRRRNGHHHRRLAKDGQLHPVQRAFHECHALQCGFCTPGMIMAGVDLIDTYPGTLTRRGGAPRDGRQSLPLHGLPQHRQGDLESRGRDPARARQRHGGVRARCIRPHTAARKRSPKQSGCSPRPRMRRSSPGGHTLLPALKLRLASPSDLIDLGAIPDLRGIKVEGRTLVIGATTLHAEVAGLAARAPAHPGACRSRRIDR